MKQIVVVLLFLYIVNIAALECRYSEFSTELQPCPLQGNATCNSDGIFCRCKDGFIVNFPHFPNECVKPPDPVFIQLGAPGPLFSPTWRTSMYFTLTLGQHVTTYWIIKSDPFTYIEDNVRDYHYTTCMMLASPEPILNDRCHRLTNCSSITGSTTPYVLTNPNSGYLYDDQSDFVRRECGWCISQKRGLAASNVLNGHSLDGTCSGSDFVLDAEMCPIEEQLMPLEIATHPVCDEINTCIELLQYNATCGWCVSRNMALERHHSTDEYSKDQSCTGANWITVQTFQDIQDLCPRFDIAGRCGSRSSRICSGNGIAQHQLSYHMHKTDGIILLSSIPYQVSESNTNITLIKSECECPYPFTGQNCESVLIQCGMNGTSCYSDSQECNPNGVGCRCKQGFVPKVDSDQCEALPFETSIVTHKYNGLSTVTHYWERNVHFQSSTRAEPLLITTADDEVECYMPYHLSSISVNQFFASRPVLCRSSSIQLCPHSSQFRWVRITVNRLTSNPLYVFDYQINTITPISSMQCYCPLGKLNHNDICVDETICGVRVNIATSSNIILQTCNPFTQECNADGHGCMCKSGTLPLSMDNNLTPVSCRTPVSTVTQTFTAVDGTSVICDVDPADLTTDPIVRKIGAYCRASHVCNGRGSQYLYLIYNRDTSDSIHEVVILEYNPQSFQGITYVSTNEAEPVMGCRCDPGWNGTTCLLPEVFPVNSVCTRDSDCEDSTKQCKSDGSGCECRPGYFPDGSNCVHANHPIYQSTYDFMINGVRLSKCIVSMNQPDAISFSLNDPSIRTIRAYCSVINIPDTTGHACSFANGKRLMEIQYQLYLESMAVIHGISYTVLSGCYCERGFYGDTCDQSCTLDPFSNQWMCFDSTPVGMSDTQPPVLTPTCFDQTTGFPIDCSTSPDGYFVNNTSLAPPRFYPVCYHATTRQPIDCPTGQQCSSSGLGCECKRGWYPTSTGVCREMIKNTQISHIIKDSNGYNYYLNIYTDSTRETMMHCWLDRYPDVSGPIRGLCNGKGICSNKAHNPLDSNDEFDDHDEGSQFVELVLDVYRFTTTYSTFSLAHPEYNPQYQFYQPVSYLWYTVSQTILSTTCQCNGLRSGPQCEPHTSCVRDYPTYPCRSVATQLTHCELNAGGAYVTYRQQPDRNTFCEPRLPLSLVLTQRAVNTHSVSSKRKLLRCFLPRATPLADIGWNALSPFGLLDPFNDRITIGQNELANFKGVLLCDDVTTSSFFNTHDRCPVVNGTSVCSRLFIEVLGVNQATGEILYKPLFTGASAREYCPLGWYWKEGTCANRCDNCTSGEYCDDNGKCQCKIGWLRTTVNSPCVYLPNGCLAGRYGSDCSQICSPCAVQGAICDDGPSGTGDCGCPVRMILNEAGTECVFEYTSTIVTVQPIIKASSSNVPAGRDVYTNTKLWCEPDWQERDPIGFGCRTRTGYIFNDASGKGIKADASSVNIWYNQSALIKVQPTTRWYEVVGIPAYIYNSVTQQRYYIPSLVTMQCTTLIDPVLLTIDHLSNVHAVCSGAVVCNGIGTLELDIHFGAQGANRVINGSSLQVSSRSNIKSVCRCPSGYISNEDRCDSIHITCGIEACQSLTEQCNANDQGCKCKPGYIPDPNTGRCKQPKTPGFLYFFGQNQIPIKKVFSSLIPRIPQTNFQLTPNQYTLAGVHQPIYNQFQVRYKRINSGTTTAHLACYSEHSLADSISISRVAYCKIDCSATDDEQYCTSLQYCGIESNRHTFYRWYSIKARVNTTEQTTDVIEITPVAVQSTISGPYNTTCDCPVNKAGVDCVSDTVICGFEYFNRASYLFDRAIVCDTSTMQCNSNSQGCRCKHGHLPVNTYAINTDGVDLICKQPTYTLSTLIDVQLATGSTTFECFVDNEKLSYGMSNWISTPNHPFIGGNCRSPVLCSGRGRQNIYLVLRNGQFVDYLLIQKNKQQPIMSCECESGFTGDDCSVSVNSITSNSTVIHSNVCGSYQFFDGSQCRSFTDDERSMTTQQYLFVNSNGGTIGTSSGFVMFDCRSFTSVPPINTPFQAMCDTPTDTRWTCNAAGVRRYSLSVTGLLSPSATYRLTSVQPQSECFCYPGFYGNQCEFLCESSLYTNTSTCRLWKQGYVVDPNTDFKPFTTEVFEGLPVCYDRKDGCAIDCPHGSMCSLSGVGCVCKPGFFPNTHGVCRNITTSVYSDVIYTHSDRAIAWKCWLERDPFTFALGHTPMLAQCAGVGVCDSMYDTRFFRLELDTFFMSSETIQLQVVYITSAVLLPGQASCLCDKLEPPFVVDIPGEDDFESNTCLPTNTASYPTILHNTQDACTVHGPDFIQAVNRNRFCTTRFPEPAINILAVANGNTLRTYRCLIPSYVPRDTEVHSLNRLANYVKLLCDETGFSCQDGSICRRGFHTFKGTSPEAAEFTVIEGVLDQCPDGFFYNQTDSRCVGCPSIPEHNYCANNGTIVCQLGYTRSPQTGLCVLITSEPCVPVACPPYKWGPNCTEHCEPCFPGAVCNDGPSGTGKCECIQPILGQFKLEVNPARNKCTFQHCTSPTTGLICGGRGMCINTTHSGEPAQTSYCVCTGHEYTGKYCENERSPNQNNDQDSYVTWSEGFNPNTTSVVSLHMNRIMYSDEHFNIPAVSSLVRVGSVSQAKYECYRNVTCDGFVIWSNQYVIYFRLADESNGGEIYDSPTVVMTMYTINRFQAYECDNPVLDPQEYANQYETQIREYCINTDYKIGISGSLNTETRCTTMINSPTQYSLVTHHWQTVGHMPQSSNLNKRMNPNGNCLLSNQIPIWNTYHSDNQLVGSFPQIGCGYPNDTHVCSNRGYCKPGANPVFLRYNTPFPPPNHCDCHDSDAWSGVHCERSRDVTCTGQYQNITIEYCSNSGECVDKPTPQLTIVPQCECSETREGEFCQTARCPGCNEPHQGQCVSFNGTNTCECKNDWTGDTCGVNAAGCKENTGELHKCNNAGDCIPTGPFTASCQNCKPGNQADSFCGPECTTLFTINTDRFICNGLDSCTCHPVYYGACNQGCPSDFCAAHNGVKTANKTDSCDCNEGFIKGVRSGDSLLLSKTLCYPKCPSTVTTGGATLMCGSVSGVCKYERNAAVNNEYTTTGTCQCGVDEIVNGDGLCEKFCLNNGVFALINGITQTCTSCAPGFEHGTENPGRCRESLENLCSNHGLPNEQGDCVCYPPWSGDTCSNHTCGPLGTPTLVPGYQTQYACVCGGMYKPSNNNNHDCDDDGCIHGKISDDGLSCNCTGIKWSGSLCQDNECNNKGEANDNEAVCECSIPWDPATDCAGHLCENSYGVDGDTCICKDGWTGPLCAIEIPSSSSSTAVPIASLLSSSSTAGAATVVHSSSSSYAAAGVVHSSSSTVVISPVPHSSSSSTAVSQPPVSHHSSSSSSSSSATVVTTPVHSSSSSTATQQPSHLSSSLQHSPSSTSSATESNQPIVSASSSSTGPSIITELPIQSSSSTLSTGAVAGIAIGATAGVVLVAAPVYLMFFKPETWRAVKYSLGLL